MMGHEHHPEERGGGGYFVRRPKTTDGIGESLRRAYDDARNLPDDLSRALRVLDRVSSRH